MIVNNSTWKNFISNHHAGAWLDGNIAAVSAAFDPTKNKDKLMEKALGVDPNIFLILRSNTMQPTLVHHVSKVPKNALLMNDVDEFFCLLGWDQSAIMAIKIDPNSFFTATHDGDNRIIGDRENGSKVRKVRTWMLKEEFSQCHYNPEEMTTVRKCIPLPPVLAKLFLSVNPSDPHQMTILTVSTTSSHLKRQPTW
jgi:hypothetical protein